MPKVLSAEQVERFHRDGFLAPVPVLSAEEVARYRGHLEAFEEKYPDDRRKLKSKSHLLCPWVDEIARNSHILDVYEDLIGANIFCYSMAFRIKEPDGRTFAGWHQDGAYNPIKPILVIGGLALSECSVETGCLSVIPGSHKTGTLPHEDTGDPNSILSRGQYITEDFDKSNAVDLELKPGEIGLFCSEIIHGSRANTGNDRRIMLLVEMMPTHVEARAHRDTGVLVRGTDEYGNVDIDPSPTVEFGPDELMAWQNATRKTGKNVFDGSPLPKTEVYGGDVPVSR
jgi:non-haem Fe2+, alpha-ketoglutarate-dependent halogenase